MVDPLVGAALISAGSSALSQIGSSVMASSGSAKAKRAATLAFNRQRQLIDEANEYNKPINQMARLEEAGLNPNLVYENGAQTLSANIGAPPQAKTFGPEAVKFDILQDIATLKNLDRQAEKTQAEIDAIHHSMDVADENLNIARENMELRDRQLGMQNKMIDARIWDMENRNSDPMFDFLSGLAGGVFSNDPIPQLGSKDMRSSAQLGMMLGRFGQDFYDEVKKYGFGKALEHYREALGNVRR